MASGAPADAGVPAGAEPPRADGAAAPEVPAPEPVAAGAGGPAAAEPVAAPAGGPAAAGAAAFVEPDHQQLLDADLLELEAKAQKADEYLELAQRTRADFENFRKRAARDAHVAEARGIAKLAKALLPAVDNLDRALTAAAARPAAEGADATLAEGIKLVHADLLGALARVGIEPFSPAGEAFDPQCHEAMAQAPVPGALAGTVVEVYQLGFRLGDTILRPARVVVAA
jgi:molecular chaperone GrpE